MIVNKSSSEMCHPDISWQFTSSFDYLASHSEKNQFPIRGCSLMTSRKFRLFLIQSAELSFYQIAEFIFQILRLVVLFSMQTGDNPKSPRCAPWILGISSKYSISVTLVKCTLDLAFGPCFGATLPFHSHTHLSGWPISFYSTTTNIRTIHTHEHTTWSVTQPPMYCSMYAMP